MRGQVDKLGLLLTALIGFALTLPFAVFSPNRIAMGRGLSIFEATPTAWGIGLVVSLGLGVLIALQKNHAVLRLIASGVALFFLIIAIGESGAALLAEASSYARVSPGSSFWLLAFTFMIMLTDAIVRLKPSPRLRLGILMIAITAMAGILLTGHLDALSIMSEYTNRNETFWREGRHHIQLAFGSLILASAIGIPLGVLANRITAIRTPLLSVLSMLQTIPSMALFGILIAPLSWLAANIDILHSMGIRGIGMAPAFVALFLYSLLPMVANTTAGLANINADISEAAKGMGMTSRQRLLQVELPLALPVILTGIRIVLVQNIGLATIAALIGGGGFGVFVFQGLGQTATDLILLGALPTVALAFAASVTLNVMIDLIKKASP